MNPQDRATRARTASGPSTGRSPLPWIALAVVVVVAVVVALLASGGDDSGDDGTDAASSSGGEALATAEVTVAGGALAPLGGGEDPAAGEVAPTLEGVAPDGTPITVEPSGEPTLLAFLAHWCPHCQAELPRLVDLAESGELEGLRPVVVLTGTDESAPNYPPADWLEREGWTGEVLVDDDGAPAAQAYGLTSYPYLVLLDGEGRVIARSAGELGEEGLRAFVDQAA